MNKNTKQNELQAAWERAVSRANEELRRDPPLGEQLSHAAGLDIKSGVQAGGLWGSTGSCTCHTSCHCPS